MKFKWALAPSLLCVPSEGIDLSDQKPEWVDLKTIGKGHLNEDINYVTAGC